MWINFRLIIDDLVEDLDEIQISDLTKTPTILTTWLDFSSRRNIATSTCRCYFDYLS
jgi:hypothetical protein